ncbi:hypothetical protein F4604DRAFT_1918543 [Suillus subluteus]|nr:hypothetical protein F4604DRAFT_1918543 [Suillus subluteus]
MLLNTSAAPSSSSSEQITSFDVVSRTLTVHDMAHDSDEHISSDGLPLLHKLMGGVGASAPSTPGMTTNSPRLPRSLFDGSLLTGKWYRSALCSIHSSSLTEVRHLSEAEIIHHRTRMHSTWVHLAQSQISYESCLPPKLIEIWQSLLLTESQLTQAFHHLTISVDLAQESALVIAGFVPQTPKDSEEPTLMATQLAAPSIGVDFENLGPLSRCLFYAWKSLDNYEDSPALYGPKNLTVTGFESMTREWSSHTKTVPGVAFLASLSHIISITHIMIDNKRHAYRLYHSSNRWKIYQLPEWMVRAPFRSLQTFLLPIPHNARWLAECELSSADMKVELATFSVSKLSSH